MSERALIWSGRGDVEMATRVPVKPGNGEVVVRVEAAGVCATDLHILRGKFPIDTPRVLGHEFAGIVESVGEGVDASRLGERVAVDPMVGCGACARCRDGRAWLCQNAGELGTTGADGGWAERAVVPMRNLHRIPAALPFDAATLVEPLNCVMSAFEKAGVRQGQTAVILGSGPAGLLFLLLARRAGCGRVVVIGGGQSRLALARRLGADTAWFHGEADLDARIRAEVGPEGADVVIEASGAGVATAMGAVRRGGTVVLYGLTGSNAPNISSDQVVTRDLTLVTGTGNTHLWPEAVQVAAAHAEELACLITHRFPMPRHRDAIDAAGNPDSAVKVVFTPQVKS